MGIKQKSFSTGSFGKKAPWGDGDLMLLVRFILVLIVLLSVCAGNLLASGESFRPRDRHYAALERREECSVRRAVFQKIRLERSEKSQTLLEINSTLKERRAALEQCAAANGFTTWANEDEEYYVALVCQEQYDLWLTPGYHIEIVEREVHELNRSFNKLNDYLQAYCGNRKL